jgi:putative SOS response-associated peptidase YedK
VCEVREAIHLESLKEHEQRHAIKCPKCGSTNVEQRFRWSSYEVVSQRGAVIVDQQPRAGEADRNGSTCAIITCEAEGGDRSIHPRMPVTLPQKAYSTWFDPKTPLNTLLSLLRPYRGLRHLAVSTLVNDPANDGPECLR